MIEVKKRMHAHPLAALLVAIVLLIAGCGGGGGGGGSTGSGGGGVSNPTSTSTSTGTPTGTPTAAPTSTRVDRPVVPLAGMQIVVTYDAVGPTPDAAKVAGSAVAVVVNAVARTVTFTVPAGTAGQVLVQLGSGGTFETGFVIRRGGTLGTNDGSGAKNLLLNGAVSTLATVAGAFNLRFFANSGTPFLYVTTFGAGTVDRILTSNGSSLGTTAVTGGVLRNAEVDRDGNLIIAQGSAAQSISRVFIAAATASSTLVAATGVDTYCIAWVFAALAANDTYWQGSLTNGTLVERLANTNAATGRTANVGATSIITGLAYDDDAKVLWVFDQSTGIVSAVELQFAGLPIVAIATTGLSNGADIVIVAGSDIIAVPNRDSADARIAAFSLSTGTLLWNQGASQAGVSIRSVQIVGNKIYWSLSNGDILVAQIQ